MTSHIFNALGALAFRAVMAFILYFAYLYLIERIESPSIVVAGAQQSLDSRSSLIATDLLESLPLEDSSSTPEIPVYLRLDYSILGGLDPIYLEDETPIPLPAHASPRRSARVAKATSIPSAPSVPKKAFEPESRPKLRSHTRTRQAAPQQSPPQAATPRPVKKRKNVSFRTEVDTQGQIYDISDVRVYYTSQTKKWNRKPIDYNKSHLPHDRIPCHYLLADEPEKVPIIPDVDVDNHPVVTMWKPFGVFRSPPKTHPIKNELWIRNEGKVSPSSKSRIQSLRKSLKKEGHIVAKFMHTCKGSAGHDLPRIKKNISPKNAECQGHEHIVIARKPKTPVVA